jgi:nucleotide-binding universal stress UspA family protein
MKRLLIPIDFSDTTEASLKYAVSVTGNADVIYHLFHIYPDQLMIPDSSFPTGIDSDAFLSAEFIHELRGQAEKNMEEIVEQMKSMLKEKGYNHPKIESLVTGGDPEWEINEICEKLDPELVIMGTRGEGNKGFLEGSMAEKIMVRSGKPVLAVPQTKKEVNIKQVMYATNFSEHDFVNIALIFDLLRNQQIRVHCVHFNLKENKSESEAMMDTLQHALENIHEAQEFQCHLIDGEEKSDILEQFISEHNIDMITFIAHKTNIFQNLFSKKIHKKDFFKLELPMLALPDRE